MSITTNNNVNNNRFLHNEDEPDYLHSRNARLSKELNQVSDYKSSLSSKVVLSEAAYTNLEACLKDRPQAQVCVDKSIADLQLPAQESKYVKRVMEIAIDQANAYEFIKNTMECKKFFDISQESMSQGLKTCMQDQDYFVAEDNQKVPCKTKEIMVDSKVHELYATAYLHCQALETEQMIEIAKAAREQFSEIA